MHDIRRILVGVDLSQGDRIVDPELSAPTREAIERAVWLAARLDAELTIFSALDIEAKTEDMLHREPLTPVDNVEQLAVDTLNGLVEAAVGCGAKANYRLTFGHPGIEIIEQVEREKIDLAVIGTRDVSRMQALLFGGTAKKLLHDCPCPVWITKPDPNWDDLNILVASDLDQDSQSAIEMAVAFACLAESKLHVLHAIEDSSAGRPEAKVIVEQRLSEQIAKAQGAELKYPIQIHVVDGSPVDAVRDKVRECGIDLLIIGISRQTGLAEWIAGHTVERLLPEIACSVFVFKTNSPA